MIILEKGERADPLWGMDTEIITDEMIEALEQGKRLYLSVNDEYAVVIKKNGKRKTDKPEATDTDTISRQAVVEAIENTDWYHLRDGVMVYGANSKEDQAWYKAEDVYKVLEELPSANNLLQKIANKE